MSENRGGRPGTEPFNPTPDRMNLIAIISNPDMGIYGYLLSVAFYRNNIIFSVLRLLNIPETIDLVKYYDRIGDES